MCFKFNYFLVYDGIVSYQGMCTTVRIQPEVHLSIFYKSLQLGYACVCLQLRLVLNVELLQRAGR